jgi:hypothetical protein
MSLCEYKDALGIPGEGLHQYRIGDVAVMDCVLTLGLAGVISHATGFGFIIVLIILILLSIMMHRAFCVRTTVDKWLFDTKKES